jgi:hypothetical protein
MAVYLLGEVHCSVCARSFNKDAVIPESFIDSAEQKMQKEFFINV